MNEKHFKIADTVQHIRKLYCKKLIKKCILKEKKKRCPTESMRNLYNVVPIYKLEEHTSGKKHGGDVRVKGL